MITLPGYQVLAKIYESFNSEVYQGIHSADNQPVILKVLKQDYPTPQELARYRQEYKTLCSLKFEEAIKTYGLEPYGRSLVIILEDFGAISLKKWIEEKSLTLSEFLEIGIKIVENLRKIHAAKVIHKDINPANIVLNPTTGQLKIIDFGIATMLQQENPRLKSPNLLEGTLAYISPEQTGRMNRSLDYRSDLYSLGVTLYELLTKQLPFETMDALELIHSHLAKQPLPPHRLNPDIPRVISQLILKLMAKTAEEGYQSADGVQADLAECLRQLKTTGTIKDFAIATEDVANRFYISQKLYGREPEIATLLEAFARVTAEPSVSSPTELMLVTGYSGVGKTTLVQEIYQPITEKQGYFISGKFDGGYKSCSTMRTGTASVQFQRNTPYSAIVDALTDLVKQILGESTIRLNRWRKKLLKALGVNGQLIINVIPELELIIGKQLALSELTAIAAQNRFDLVFSNFIRVFCSFKHPLVIFLDDLQWADSASLKLIERIMLDADFSYLFLIGSYRHNEITAIHPLTITLDKLRREGAIVNQINLKPLALDHVEQLIADTLNREREYVRSLAELVWQKTNGNPFFINEFLKSIYADNLLVFNPAQYSCDQAESHRGYWQWDLKQIEKIGSTDNLVQFMIGKMQKLPQSTQGVLSIAACVGAEFDLNTIAIVAGQSAESLRENLTLMINAGLIIPLSEIDEQLLIQNYKFGHDRIQQAAYALIEQSQKLSVHLKIGCLLRENTPPEELSDKIFQIVDHLNIGQQLISDHLKRTEIARLNLLAGQKAKAANAYDAALQYFKLGQEFLTDESWQTDYNLILGLYSEAAEVAYLNGDFEQMEHFALVVLQQAQTLLDRVKVYQVKLEAYQAQNQDLTAIQMALSLLENLEFTFSASPQLLEVQQELAKTQTNLAGKQIEDLIDLPQMSDPEKLAVMKIASSIFSSIYIAAPQLLPILVSKQVNLSIRYGNTSLSAFAYVNYGLILCGVVGEIETGYQFGRLALNLADKLQKSELIPRITAVFSTAIGIWQEPVRNSLASLQSAYQIGLEMGDLYYGTTCAYLYSFHSAFVGKELANLAAEITAYTHAFSKLKQQNTLNYLKIYGQAVLNLLGGSENAYFLQGELYDESIMIPQHQSANDRYALCALYVNKLYLCCLFGEYHQAVANANQAQEYLDGATATLLVPLFHFYDALAHLGIYHTVAISEQQQILIRVTARKTKMQQWAEHAPMNYLHKFYLIQAEQHRIQGFYLEAMDFTIARSLRLENITTLMKKLAPMNWQQNSI